MTDKPEGIIITISLAMLKERGYRNWLRNYLNAMQLNADGQDYYYYMRQGARPKREEISYVYLCIGGKVRYRSFYAGSLGPKTVHFSDGRTMTARAWVILAGPVERAPYHIPMKGFQGFRYCEKLF